jgi:hypothetical protein
VTLGPRAGFAFLAAAVIGCAGDEPRPELFAIQPGQAFSNKDVRVQLLGSGLIPSFRVSPSTDQRVAVMDGFSGRIGKDPVWAPLTLFGWLGPDQLSATLTSEDAEELVGSPDMFWDVEITDPRGRKATLEGAFKELGMDGLAPSITVDSPAAGQVYCPGATIHAQIKVYDEEPGYLTSVRWELPGPSGQKFWGFCPIEPGASRIQCGFDVKIDEDFVQKDTIHLSVEARDGVGNQNYQEFPIWLDARPSVSEVIPNAGPTTGGTDVVISGSGFAPDSRAYFGDALLFPNGGQVLENGTVISGYAPAHRAGKVTVKVVSSLGEVSLAKVFEYLDSPPEETP